MAGRLTRGEVRLVTIGHPNKTRPCVILTRNSALTYRNAVTVAPVTSAIRGVPSEVRLGERDGMKLPCVVNAHNVTTVPLSVIGRRVAQMSEERIAEVCGAIGFSIGCAGTGEP